MPLDSHDMISLIKHCGISDNSVATWLLSTHYAVREAAPRGEAVTLVDLLQVLQLAAAN